MSVRRTVLSSSLIATLVAISIAGLGCRGGTNTAPPAVTNAKTSDPRANAASSRPAMARPTVRPVLDDPRLARAKDLDRAKDYAGALRALRDARAGITNLSPEERCAWDHTEGRLASAANATAEALAAFERAEDTACPLSGWAKLRSAQAIARSGRADDAIVRARAVPDDIVAARDEVKIVLAESLAAKGDRAQALPLWREWLAANPHGNRWVDTSVRIATALLDGLDGPVEQRAREAYDLATKVMIEAPKLADSSGAAAARARAVGVLRPRDASVTEALSDLERAKQAQAWLDLGEPTKAFELASATFASAGGAASKTAAACKAALTRASAAAKARGVKLNGWPDAVAACERDEQLVNALYSGAKASASKDPKQAIEWFARVEQAFPSHRLADDARYRGALLVAQSTDEGHEARAEEMLRSLADAYPNGDMRTEGLFRVALGKMQRGDWEGAKGPLDRIVELQPEDRHWATAARAEYFRARAAAMTNDREGARARLVRIVERHPLAFYMLLAHARLAQEDPGLAARTLKEAQQRDADGAFPSKVHAVLESPAVARAARLLEVGDVDAARREVSAAGALADDADTEVVWAIGALYNQAGLPELGHSFSRGRLTDHLAHYPEGKWRVPWEVAYPRAYEPLVVKHCGENQLPTPVAWGVMREESSFIADVRSHSNAFGLMQLIVPTAKWVAAGTSLPSDEAALKRPEVNIELGTRLLTKLRATHKHPALAIGAYNGGGGAVERWVSARATDELDLFVELVPYDETRNYIKRVLSSQAAYAYLYDPAALKEPLELPLRVTAGR
ncbi:MAG: transglycosylase SLT domain-containing protein [Deltaproteobacteria bacterium]|nr:transglycosylase SLT domain-containing protein [Deltaproteobacteria bacterium]